MFSAPQRALFNRFSQRAMSHWCTFVGWVIVLIAMSAARLHVRMCLEQMTAPQVEARVCPALHTPLPAVTFGVMKAERNTELITSVDWRGVRSEYHKIATDLPLLFDAWGIHLDDVLINHIGHLLASMSRVDALVDRVPDAGERRRIGDAVTDFMTGGKLIGETVLYRRGTATALATIKGEVGAKELRNFTFAPAPGQAAALPVPDWRVGIFKREAWVERLNEKGKLLKEPVK